MYNKRKNNEGVLNMTTIKTASKRQLWALYCITKQDYRDKNLTYDQASVMIKELGDPNYTKKTVTKKDDNDAVRIHNEAVEAGMKALNECTPIPMVVEQHVNVLDDNSPVTKAYYVEGGVCGFAEIRFKATTPENRKFLNGCKKAGLAGEDKFENKNVVWTKSYQGGFSYWVSVGGQSMAKKEAFAYAYNEVLNKYGIKAYVSSRMD